MLEIGRVRFRVFKREDLHLLECWENFHEGTLYARGQPMVFKNKDEIEKEYEKYLENSDKQRFIIETREDDKAIGFASYEDHSQDVRNATIGAFIGDKTYWNKGFGKEITIGLCEMLFFQHRYDRLSAWTSSVNHRSQHVLQDIGFKHSGTSRKSGYLYGKRIDWYMYDILREEYLPERDKLLDTYIPETEEFVKRHCKLS